MVTMKQRVADDSCVKSSTSSKKRKHDQSTELEIDLNAPEPPSKKDQRKAKKIKSEAPKTSTVENSNGSFKEIGEDPKPNRGTRSQYGIWIGNLSFTTTKQELVTFMTSDSTFPLKEDQITRINLPSGDSKNGKAQNKGFAYIDLIDEESLKRALELSEKLLVGRRVLIKDARSFEGRPAKSENSKDNTKAPSRRIFIGNLDFDTDTESLEEHFGVCGKIKNTHVATFEDSGKCKGYAWVEFEDLSSAEAAMRGWVEEGHAKSAGSVQRSSKRIWLHKIEGRKLRLEYAEDPTTRYNKRFAKGAPERNGSTTRKQVNNDTEVGDGIEDDTVGKENNTQTSARSNPRARKGYEGQAVQRLTGAIVESKGQKVVFD